MRGVDSRVFEPLGWQSAQLDGRQPLPIVEDSNSVFRVESRIPAARLQLWYAL